MVLANLARRFAGVLAAVAILLAGCADAPGPAKSATGDVSAQAAEDKKDEKSVANKEGTRTIVLAVSEMT